MISRQIPAQNVNESYSYDAVGNILSKAGVGYDYTHNDQLYGHPSGSGGPYAVRNSGYSYDKKGNMLSEKVWA